MAHDGGLRGLFRTGLPHAFFQAIESWGVGAGVPDDHFLFSGGASGWIEFKKTDTNKVGLKPAQVGWAMRYSRMGGSCFVAVRKTVVAGKRKTAEDSLFVIRGRFASSVVEDGLAPFYSSSGAIVFEGGPRAWDWKLIEAFLRA